MYVDIVISNIFNLNKHFFFLFFLEENLFYCNFFCNIFLYEHQSINVKVTLCKKFINILGQQCEKCCFRHFQLPLNGYKVVISLTL